MAVATVILLAAAVYTHLRIPRHTKGRMNRAILRGVLIVIGIAFGYATARFYVQTDGIRGLLALLGGFGLVHVPAAFILFLKRQRGDGQS